MIIRALKTAAQTALGLVLGISMAGAIVLAPARALAQEVPTSQTAATRAVVAARGQGPALWVIRDADSTIYLFGTVHVLRPDTPWGSARVDQALASADELWLEVANVDDVAAIAPLIQAYGLSPDRPLSSQLTPDEMADLDAAARTIGASGAQLDRMRPWLAAMTLSMAPLVKAGYDPQSGVELVLKGRAGTADTPVRGLETLEQQITILATLPEVTQLAYLRSTLETFDEAGTELDSMVSGWARGDLGEMEASMADEMKAQSIYLYDALLVRRNADWAEQIDTLLDGSGTQFIAVGSGHLVGEDSVIAMLRERGIEVQVAP